MSSVFDSLTPQTRKKPAANALKRHNRKLYKEKQKEKRARLIVRNLPFSTTEENLREYYERFGEVVEVELLKKPDGNLRGCAFVQFKLVQNAAKARHHTNGKEFIGRQIECDFALSKHKYEEKVRNEKQIKQEGQIKSENEIKQEVVEIKEEPVDDYESNRSLERVDVKCEQPENGEFKRENDDEDDDEKEDSPGSIPMEDEQIGDSQETASNSSDKLPLDDQDEDMESEAENSSDEESEDEDITDSKPETKDDERFSETNSVSSKKPHVVSNDVAEGKTVFIKNVPFDATNEDLRECMSQFGPLQYALICIDKLTEHSKGTAFAKFKSAEDAEKCLQAGTELTLMGNVLDCHRALNRNDLQAQHSAQKDPKQRDTRNLYLVKEGVVLAGSRAAEGLSASDMAKRLQLEQYKTQILRNLNMFVSKTRLIIHNLPASWDDAKLRALFKRHAGAGAVIKEARVMRNMRDVDSRGVGKSKEYGFVSFMQHEHALRALRALNNNPAVFSPHKRPIVAFSIENRSLVKGKEKRLQRSKLKNPNSKDYDPDLVKSKKGEDEEVEMAEPKEFSGTAAKPGVLKMRSRYNLKTQAKLHYEHLKKQKKKMKFSKKTLEQKKQEFIRQPRQKINKKPKGKVDDHFSKLVSGYKQKLLSADPTKKSKWYEG